MKRVSLLFILFALCGTVMTVSAQRHKPYNPKAKVKAIMDKTNFIGTEPVEAHLAPTSPDIYLEESAQTNSAINREEWVGKTDYDLQSNSAGQNRLSRRADGNSACVWTFGTGQLSDGVADRGTGYNLFNVDDDIWGPLPEARLESNTRTGWPNYVVTGSGTEFVVSHSADNELHTLRRENGQGSWMEGTIPTNVTPGLLWPRAAASGDYIHVIAVSTPIANDGTAWLGMDPALLYFRSSDGGETWDVTDVQPPGITSAEFIEIDADSYVIEANGPHVAMALLSGWGDVVMIKSSDNGDSWTPRIVNDFPLDLYATDDGYTLADIGGEPDLNGPYDPEDPDPAAELAIFSSDGSGSLAIANDGTVHLVFGQMYITDDDLADGNSSYYPGTSGVSYWNDTYEDGAHVTIDIIDEYLDVNGNDTLDIDGEIALYFLSLTSFLNLSIDDAGDLVLAYSQLMENYQKEDSNPNNQHYRHAYLTASGDNGVTWETPYNTVNEDVLKFPILLSEREAVFNDVHHNGGSAYSLYYQFDDEPGLHVRGDEDPFGENTIMVWDFDKTEIFPGLFTSLDVVAAADLKFAINPNPANDLVQVKYNLTDAARTTITVANLVGQTVMAVDQGNQTAGEYNLDLNVNNLAKGIYIVSLRTNDSVATQKLVVSK